MAQQTRIRGYRELLRACDRAGPDSKKQVRSALRDVGDVVKDEAASLFEGVDAKSAAGYRIRVRQRGVAVEQSLRRTTGERPDFGAKQMNEALMPALQAKENEIERRLEDALEKIADHFAR